MPPGAATCVFAIAVVTICADGFHVALNFARVINGERTANEGRGRQIGREGLERPGLGMSHTTGNRLISLFPVGV